MLETGQLLPLSFLGRDLPSWSLILMGWGRESLLSGSVYAE